MKTLTLTLIITLMTMGLLQAQKTETLIDRSGEASFYSEAPLEDIEAANKEVVGAINLSQGTLAVSMMMKDFHFEQSLMEEHFNENYVESDKYPKATFKGVIKDFKKYDFSKSGSFEVTVDGEIQIHGVKKPLVTPVKFDIASGAIQAETSFNLTVADFDIEVPKLVIKNIAEVVEVKTKFNFKP